MSKPELALYAKEDGTGRAYKHPFRLGADGKPLTSPSVTTVLKYENKDNLVQWAADLTAKWAQQNWMTLGSRSDLDAFKTARFRWRDVRDERAEVGTGVHETIEAIHTDSWELPLLDPEQREIMEQWRLLNEEWEIVPVLTEFTVWNFTHDYVGTGDGLWSFTNRKTGETFLALADIKTSRNTWPGHWAQLAALLNGEVVMVKTDPTAKSNSKGEWPEGSWREDDWGYYAPNGVYPIEKVVIVHLRAAERDERGNVTKDAKHDILEATDLDLHFKRFLAYRTLWGVDQELSSREKERTTPVYGEF